MGQTTEPDLVKSLIKGMKIVEFLNARKSSATLSEVAYGTGVTRAAARRFLLTFESLGYVQFEHRQFRLTAKVLSLSSAFSTSESLATLSIPILKNLTQITGESCSVSVLQGKSIVYVARQSTTRVMSVNISLGVDFPAFYTSMGRAIIAHLDEPSKLTLIESCELSPMTERSISDKAVLKKELLAVKNRGFALVNQELELGLISLAVPIFKNDIVIAAINIACSTAMHKPSQMVRQFLPELQAKALELGKSV